MSEDEAITIYTFVLVIPSLFGIKRITKSAIDYLPTHGKCRDKSLQAGLAYGLEKMLDPAHQHIKLIIVEKYYHRLSLKAMARKWSSSW